ncbi:hypothetical protein Rsph17029_0770 [Rhodobacter sphaeroides ATCC 17029]|nr:hypothetical protein Rsph17029_0770 [Cereibacter sphaeroides ATCC 17029]
MEGATFFLMATNRLKPLQRVGLRPSLRGRAPRGAPGRISAGAGDSHKATGNHGIESAGPSRGRTATRKTRASGKSWERRPAAGTSPGFHGTQALMCRSRGIKAAHIPAIRTVRRRPARTNLTEYVANSLQPRVSVGKYGMAQLANFTQYFGAGEF